MADEEMFLLSL